MSRSRPRRKHADAPPVSLEILSLSHEGRGIGRLNGKVAFVAGALPGESVTARLLNRRSQFDEFQVLTVASAASDRVDPPCEYAGVCGGCSLQHLHPQAQLAFKEATLLEQLRSAAGLAPGDFEVLPRLAGERLHYRRKARLAVRLVLKKGGVLVGFREKHGTFITDMVDCQVLVREVASLISPLRQLLGELDCRAAVPQIEVAVGETGPNQSETVVALVIRHLEPCTEADLAALKIFADRHRLRLYLQPGGIDSVHRLYPRDGGDCLRYFLPEFDLEMEFHPLEFTQINAGINRQIVSRAVKLLELTPDDRVLDLFCGLGNFTLPIARHCASVTGVEGSAALVARAAANADRNGIDNAQFTVADLSGPLADQSWLGGPCNKVLLDPPRSGAIEILPALVKLRPEKIVYVSCNPTTLARDAAYLISRDYKLKSAGVMDMFPHTVHVESIAEFVPRRAADFQQGKQ